jgi:uncharacterized protein YjiS (DUF1127 family)
MAHTHVLTAPVHDASLSQRFGNAVKRGWADYRTYRARRATILALHALDDSLLKDIGISRSEIESVAYELPCNNGRLRSRRIAMCGRV